MQSWKRIEPTKVTKVGWRAITTKTFELPDGKAAEYDLVYTDGQEFVSIVALTPDDKVIIGREYAPGPEKVMDELPGGYVDMGESAEASVRRELLEETGYAPKEMKYLGSYFKDKYINATWHAFLATGCEKVREQELEDNEFIDVVLLSVGEFLDSARNGLVTDHGAILAAYDELLKLKEGK